MIICPKCYSYDKCKAMGYADAEKCANYDPRMKPKTNFDRIKSMSIEEMVEFIHGITTSIAVKLNGEYVSNDTKYIKEYLESEVQEDECL